MLGLVLRLIVAGRVHVRAAKGGGACGCMASLDREKHNQKKMRKLHVVVLG